MLYQRNSLILQSLWSVQVIYSLGVHFIFLRNSSWKTLNNSPVFLILISCGDLPFLIGADLHFRTFSLRINKDQLRLHDNLLTTSSSQPLLSLVHLIYSHLIVQNSCFFFIVYYSLFALGHLSNVTSPGIITTAVAKLDIWLSALLCSFSDL